ncbi:MAG: serine/threonine-protein kinase [Acidobacteriota bacterium]
MAAEREDLERLAAAIAEGRTVDWPLEIGAEEASPELDNLRALAGIQELFARQGRDEERPRGTPSFRWGHLKVGELLGRGAYGEVYRAFDTVLQRQVALKLRRGDQADGQAYIAEARRLAQVRHPHVLAVHGADVHDGRVGLWADLIEGSTLDEVLDARGALPEAQVLDVAAALASALEAVHAQSLVHGDVKGSNVMLEGATPVLMDFGAGTDLQSSGSSTAAGSPLSMAPELFRGIAPSAAGDLYALGALLFRLLNGRYPVEAESLDQLRRIHEEGKVVQAGRGPLRKLAADLLDARPEQRPTAARVVERVETLRRAPALRRRRRAMAAIIGVLVLGVLATSAGLVEARRSERRAQTLSQFLRDVLAKPQLASKGPNVRVTDVVREAALRLEEDEGLDPDLRLELLDTLGFTYSQLGLDQQSLALNADALRLAEELRPPGDPLVLRLATRLALNRLEMGELEAARDALLALEGDVDKLPIGHATRPYYLRSRSSLADAEGDGDSALRLAREAVEAGSAGRADDEYPFRLAQSDLGEMLLRMGEYEPAEELLRESLQWYERRFGLRNFSSLVVRTLLAEALDRQGRTAEAIPVMRQVVTTARDWLGEDEPRYAAALANFSTLLGTTGQFEEALEVSLETQRLLERDPVENEGPLLTLLNNRGKLYFDLGRYQEAEGAYRQALAGWLRRPLKNPNELVVRFNLSEVLLLSGRPEAALAEARRARPLMVERTQEDHLFVLVTDGVIGGSLSELGRLKEAERVLERAVERSVAVLGAGHPSTLDNELYLARNEWRLGRRSEALARAERVAEGRGAVFGDEHGETLEAWDLVAEWRAAP